MTSPDIEAVHDMTPLQKGMVFHSAMHPADSFYVEQVTFGVGLAMSPEILQRALDHATRRHQALRTGFFWESVKAPVQVVFRKVRIPVEHLDWSLLPSDEQGGRFQSLLEQDRSRAFDLRRAPLFRATIVRVGRNACQLLFTFHHALLDGWSLNRLFREIWEVYRALEAGQTPSLAPAPSYAEFLSWLGRRDPEESRRYWAEALHGLAGPIPLPVLREPSPSGGRSVGHLLRDIPADLTGRLQKLARTERVTLSTVFQVAWAILLSRLSARDEAVFGTIVSGRPADLDGVEEMIGLFINTVPRRIPIAAGANVADTLRQAQASATRQRDFEHCSLTDIQGWSEVANGTAMFETLFIFENLPGATKAGTGQAFAFERTNYPLTLLIAPAERISLKVLYEEARLSREGARTILEQFVSVCEAMARAPMGPVADVMPLTEAERRQPSRETIDALSVDVLWRNRMKATPDAVCVIEGGRQLTVAELDQRAAQVRGRLQAAGVERGDVVAIRGTEGADLVTAMVAVLTAGAAFLLVDPGYPLERQRQMFAIASPRCIVGIAPEGSDLPVVDPRGTARPAPPARGLRPSDAAFLVFTSGSTGQPKAVVQTHGALSNRLIWAWQAWPFAADDRSVHKTQLGFVDAIAEILAPVLGGSPLVIAPEETQRDPAALCDLLAAQSVTRLICVPSLLTAILGHIEAAGQELPRLRMVTSSGESLRAELVRSFAERLPHVTLVNLYGSSEVMADITVHVCDLARPGDTIPIGTDISGIEIRLLDDRLRPVPVGAIGELYVCGAGLARGYLRNPRETAARFLPDLHRRGERMFRTGDLARRRHDGQLIFAGRTDHQINLRGTRMEPEEIEAICAAQDGVAAAVALAIEDGALTVAVLPRPGSSPDMESVRAAVTRLLPRHMWPDRLVAIDRLPCLPNGKIDRSAVGALLGRVNGASSRRSEPPHTEIEKRLAAIWADLLSVPEPGRRDDFFALGGHSVLAMQLASRVLKQTGVRLPLHVIFERPSLADMAAALARQVPAPASPRIQRARGKLVAVEEPRR
ncbi:amino acid adenylation domain-containing protein [Mesorhizobium sp. M0204]|uniref:amino acid adenylation domain-containing protein n=1 Tax=unclassified Mesorhizobium TaxID=325217 RepID=UPI00333B1A81